MQKLCSFCSSPRSEREVEFPLTFSEVYSTILFIKIFGGSGRKSLDMSSILKVATKLTNTNIFGARALALRRCTTAANTDPPVKDVPGLSKKIVDISSGKVGFPEAAKDAVYKNPEYFCYNNVSYFEAEVEMLKYRLPQPSNKPKK